MTEKPDYEELEAKVRELEDEISRYRLKTAMLKESEARYKGIFEHTKNGVAVCKAVDNGEDFIFVEFNKAGETIDNIGREKVIGKSVLELFPGLGLFQTFQRVWATGIPEHHPAAEYEDGGLRGWRENFVYKLPSGEIVSIYNDKTKEKEAGNALKESEERLRQSEAQKKAILDGIKISLSFVNENLSVLWANKAAANSIGKSPEDMIGKKCYEVRSGLKSPCTDCPAAKTFKSKKTEQTVMHTPDGRIWHGKSEPVFDDRGELMGVLEISEDITDRTRFEERVRQAQKMESVASLAGGIAHQFNNALFGIFGNIDLLRLVLPKNEKTDKYIKSISDSAQRVTHLTKQLATYAHGGKYQPRIISLTEFVESRLSGIRSSLNPPPRITTDLVSDIPRTEADVTQMQMVLSAVISNSAEAIESDGFIHISTGKEVCNEDYSKVHPGLRSGTYVSLTIRDNGKGMDETTKRRIFDPFFSTKFQGRGLSMAAVYGIVYNHDGWISVDSELGKGTVVRIYLPAIA